MNHISNTRSFSRYFHTSISRRFSLVSIPGAKKNLLSLLHIIGHFFNINKNPHTVYPYAYEKFFVSFILIVLFDDEQVVNCNS